MSQFPFTTQFPFTPWKLVLQEVFGDHYVSGTGDKIESKFRLGLLEFRVK